MGLTARCPKCETALREGTRRCPMCATPLVADPDFEPRVREGDPVIDPLLDLFERDEMVKACPSCRNEFASHVKRCPPCGVSVVSLARSQHEAALVRRPIADRGNVVAAGPPKPPSNLQRVFVCADAAETAERLLEFRALGVRVWPGSDALDADSDGPAVGLWVREPDAPAADYLLGGRRLVDGARKKAPPPVDARARDLAEASAYLGFGRYRRAAAIAGRHRGDPEAAEIQCAALLGAGLVREAERRAVAEAAEAKDAPARAALLLLAGVFAALGNDGAPFGVGARTSVAAERLAASIAERPRFLDAGKALVEVHLASAHEDRGLIECRRLVRLNPNLFAHDGWFRTTFDALRLKRA